MRAHYSQAHTDEPGPARPVCRLSLLPEALVALLAVGSLHDGLGQQTVVVRPKLIDSVLYNPGIGVEVFHTGTQPASYPPSRIYYWRFNWIDIEQQRGRIDFAKIDRVLADARSRGQRVGMRIMAVNDYGCEVCVPQYVVDAAGGTMVRAGADGAPYSRVFWPNYNAAFMDAVESLMTALGDRYDGHPDLNHIDLGFFGCWGEYNSSCTGDTVRMWTTAIRNRNTDIHFSAFPSTPIIAQGGDSYAAGKGAGWRGDCFGDWGMWGSGWNHMEDAYPQSAAACADCWKKGMVSFEVCGVLQNQADNGFDFAQTVQKGLEWHMSSMNAKSADIPASYQPILREALKRMGYRLAVRALRHPAAVAPGDNLPVSLDWENLGVAPPYHPYVLRMRLSARAGGDTVAHDFACDVRQWLPGTVTVAEDIPIPADLDTGVYSMRLALLFPHNKQPAIRLAIEGRDPEGWYPLSQVRVVAGSGAVRRRLARDKVVRISTSAGPPGSCGRVLVHAPCRVAVTMGVFDCRGAQRGMLYNGWVDAGEHVFVWDKSHAPGRTAAAGVFLIQGEVAGVRFAQSLPALGSVR